MFRTILFIFFSLAVSTPLQGQVIAYHPNKHWQVTGKLRITSRKPAFNTFFPQYGYPQRMVNGTWESNEWKAWYIQNGFSSAFTLDGHSWQVVIERNKETFKAHPDYLAEVNGIRLGYEKTSKFCVSNKSLQALFVEDRIKAFKEQKDIDGSIGVEPSDGGGFCECRECKKLGSISNQVFFLANLTAKAIRQRFPQGKVNLLAYFQHAKVPDFDLEPNVHVTVIPEGFQTDYDPDVMLVLWAKKAKLRTYYEYFSIPQWKGDLPRLHIQNYLRRMEIARKYGYQGFWFETGLNIHAAISLQLFNQLWLNPERTWNDVSEQFLKACFKNSYISMKRMFTRWWHTWIPEKEIPMALNDLAEATALAKDKDEKERINDLKAYLHYVVLYQEWAKDTKNKEAAAELFDYIYNTSHMLILHPIAFYSIYESYLPQENPRRYNMFVNSDWTWLKPATTETIIKNFNNDLAKYGKQLSDFSFTVLSEVIPENIKQKMPYQMYSKTSMLSEKIFLLGKGKIKIELEKSLDYPEKNDEGLLISLLALDGSLITHQFIPYKRALLEIQLPKEGVYSIALSQFFQTKFKLSGHLIPIITYEQKQALDADKVNSGIKSIPGAAKNKSFYFVLPGKS